jgi:SOS response regulatory protein OraA/RecX
MPVVTALRSRRGGRVAVDLDGGPWRVLPLEAVLAAGLDAGVALDRPRARRLGRELRRLRARDAALRALRLRDHTTATLRCHLEARGVPARSRDVALETMQQAGLVDDARFAAARARALAGRGAGDLRIRDDLERRGVAAEVVLAALEELEPERDRAARLFETHGRSRRALRRLVANGFGDTVLEDLVADLSEPELR